MKLGSVILYVLMVLLAWGNSIRRGESRDETIDTVALYAVIGMFVVSGLDKLIPPAISGLPWGGSDVARLAKIYQLPAKYLSLMVVLGGLAELSGSWYALKGHKTGDIRMKRMGLSVLTAFTVAATLLVYANTVVGLKKIPVVSNINTIGGILALWS